MFTNFKTKCATAFACAAFAIPSASSAATVDLIFGRPSSPNFVQKADTTRSLLVEVLNRVRVTELGVRMSLQAAEAEIEWNIFSTDENGENAARIYTATGQATQGGPVTEAFDTATNVVLDPGFYYFQMSPNVRVSHTPYINSLNKLPFKTADGNFVTYDGFGSFFDTNAPFGPSRSLVDMSVTAELAPLNEVPLPAGLPMLLSAIGVAGMVARGKKR